METFLYLCSDFKTRHIVMVEQQPKFSVLYSEEADAFLSQQPEKVRIKILYNIARASYINDPKIFKKLENTEIWEFRTLFDNIQYRLLAFWDKRDGRNTLVIATHGFIKKTQKTPQGEIKHAQTIMDIYFNRK